MRLSFHLQKFRPFLPPPPHLLCLTHTQLEEGVRSQFIAFSGQVGDKLHPKLNVVCSWLNIFTVFLCHTFVT